MNRISKTTSHAKVWAYCEGLERALRAFPNVHQTESCEKCGCPVIVRYERTGTGDKQIKWYKCADPECSFVKTIREGE